MEFLKSHLELTGLSITVLIGFIVIFKAWRQISQTEKDFNPMERDPSWEEYQKRRHKVND